MSELTPVRRRELRASAHHLNPVVSIAGNGLTPAVLGEIDRSLQAHELIKIKVHGAERAAREALMKAVCEALDASPVQHIGTILVIWRQRREEAEKSVQAKPVTSSASTGVARAKSARAFAAAARRTALIKAASDKKRLAAKRSRTYTRKTGPAGSK
ncbi:YhbY family RNA-binding protein [Aromatoleum bremense]|uniref:Ribosome assembly RNA-binding protein YhbY n=1 Tax=Aromatoleum bremense TaxID=76115 RepID=A0ABX1NUU9_9RHOO|nr:YhbY family RNA-binding protein [Aromatoleum bremense]NMG15793.1 ribosome assembly RNA-binding protein YhbY [Aromatoleum bremense]QTQ30678.1 Putative RNA-binding protein [Aromatoleum bremense]